MVTSDYEGDQKPALLNAQALGKEKAKEEVRYSVMVKALPESGSRKDLDSRERSEVWKGEGHVGPVHSETVLDLMLPLVASE